MRLARYGNCYGDCVIVVVPVGLVRWRESRPAAASLCQSDSEFLNPRARDGFTFLLDQGSQRAGISSAEAHWLDRREYFLDSEFKFIKSRSAGVLSLLCDGGGRMRISGGGATRLESR